MDRDRLAFANDYGYEHKSISDKLDTLQRPGSPIKMGLETTVEGTVLPYFYVRTSSWNWPGERTDLNDIISTIFAAVIRSDLTACCRFLEVANSFSGVPGELYARYLVPEQPFATGYLADDDSLHNSLRSLISGSFVAEEFVGMLLRACGADQPYTEGAYKARDADLNAWAERIQHILGGRDSRAVYNLRMQPNWWYYRAVSGTAIVRSDDLAAGFAVLGQAEQGRSTHRNPQYGSRISLADQGNPGVAGEPGAFVEPS